MYKETHYFTNLFSLIFWYYVSIISFLCNLLYFTLFIFLKIIFREGGREGDREGEKHLCARETSIGCLLHASQCMSPTGDPAHNPGVCPGHELNWQPFRLQDDVQPTEPHQPGLYFTFKDIILRRGPQVSPDSQRVPGTEMVQGNNQGCVERVSVTQNRTTPQIPWDLGLQWFWLF